jgi:hypothetical protein
MLCDICQKIIFQSRDEISGAADITPEPFNPDGYVFSPHQPSKAALYKSQLDGCHFCALLWFALEEYGSTVVAGLQSLNGVWLWYYGSPADKEIKKLQVTCQNQTTRLDVFKPESISTRSSMKQNRR